MASIKRFIHPMSKPMWQPLAQVAPDVNFTLPASTDGNGADPPVPMGLVFLDPDQEMNIYIFDETGRKALIEQLTGIVLPK